MPERAHARRRARVPRQATAQRLPKVTWKLPVQHVVEPSPFPHCRPSSHGRVAAAPPPPLAGDPPAGPPPQIDRGESNRRSPLLVCLATLHLAAGELATTVGPEGEELRLFV
jgi:hypothetical protein